MKTARREVCLVFGESSTDLDAIQELVRALRPDLPAPSPRRKPLVLVKGRAQAEVRKNSADLARVVRAESVRNDVRVVFAHQDADAVEPAHEVLADTIEAALKGACDAVVAVVPAWEMETWWFLWPAAVAAIHAKWAPLKRSGTDVGQIANAKEALRRDLRPKASGKPPRDYEESDGPRIAEKVRTLGIVGAPVATSASWRRFAGRVYAL